MEFFQPRFWGLDPVFSARVKLNIVDVLSLLQYPGFPDIYCVLNHPISTVHIMGDIVSISKKNRLILYEVDDGTGVLSCCQWRKVEDSDQGIFIPQLGQLVSVFGRPSEFREERQLKVNTIVPEQDPNSEPLHWLQITHLKETVYSKPFTLPPGITSDYHKDSTKSVPSRDAIREVVLQYLNSPTCKKSFTLTELRTDKELERRCLGAVGDGFEQLPQVLVAIVSGLPREAVLIPAKHALRSMSGETVFEVYSETKHMFPVILDYITRKQSTPNGEKFGVPEKWIIEEIKKKESFSQLPISMITTALEHLIEQSKIFPLGHKVYKCIV